MNLPTPSTPPLWCGNQVSHGPHIDDTGVNCCGVSPDFERPRPLHYETIVFDDDALSLQHQLDVSGIVRDMIAQINAAEEGVREQVMVAWLRQHGWHVEKIEDPAADLVVQPAEGQTPERVAAEVVARFTRGDRERRQSR